MKREWGGEGEGEREGEEELPLFIFRAHAQWPPLLPVTLFIAVHPPGVDGGGDFFWGGSRTGRSRS